jgi:hypothetical protein
VGGGKVPDAKTMGRWGVAVGPEVLKQVHDRVVTIARDKGVIAGRRMRVDTTAGGLLWHFAAMWLLVANRFVYLIVSRSQGRCPSPLPRMDSWKMCTSSARWLPSGSGNAATPMEGSRLDIGQRRFDAGCHSPLGGEGEPQTAAVARFDNVHGAVDPLDHAAHAHHILGRRRRWGDEKSEPGGAEQATNASVHLEPPVQVAVLKAKAGRLDRLGTKPANRGSGSHSALSDIAAPATTRNALTTLLN